MDSLEDYFPTKAVKRAEARMSAVLRAESDRLKKVGPLNVALVKESLQDILKFTKEYHSAFMGYLDAVLPQHKKPVKCGPNCGNCCHHYPMSIEPFEQISFYASIRERSDLFAILEACLQRQEKFAGFAEIAMQKENPSEDPEEDALHDFFASGLSCPFLLKSTSCGVYDARPVTCRMYFSQTAPEFCTAEWLQTEKNKSFIVYLPDYIEEAIAEISEYYAEIDLPEALYAGVVRMNALDGEIF